MGYFDEADAIADFHSQSQQLHSAAVRSGTESESRAVADARAAGQVGLTKIEAAGVEFAAKAAHAGVQPPVWIFKSPACTSHWEMDTLRLTIDGRSANDFRGWYLHKSPHTAHEESWDYFVDVSGVVRKTRHSGNMRTSLLMRYNYFAWRIEFLPLSECQPGVANAIVKAMGECLYGRVPATGNVPSCPLRLKRD